MKKALAWLIGLAIIFAVAYKGLAWWQVSQRMTDLKQQYAGELALQHGWIDADFSGVVRIQDLTVTPFQLRKPVQIETLEIDFGSVWKLLAYQGQQAIFQKDELPDQLEVRLNDARLPVTENWNRFDAVKQTQEPWFVLACGDVSDIGISQLQAIGYSQLVVDQTLGYEFDAARSELAVWMKSQVEGMGTWTMRFELGQVESLEWPPATEVAPPGLKALHYSHEDISFIKKIRGYCRERTGQNPEQWVNESVRLTKKSFAGKGIGLNQKFLAAYRTFLEGDSVIEMSLRPPAPVDYAALAFVAPEQVLQDLGFRLSVNRIEIPGATASVDSERLLQTLFPPPPSVEVSVEVGPSKEPAVPERKAAYYLVAEEQLEGLVGERLRVTLDDGKVLEGRLIVVKPYGINIQASIQKGVVEYPIARNTISQVEVWQE